MRARRAASALEPASLAPGDVVGDWEVVSPPEKDGAHLRAVVRCRVCGFRKAVRLDNLRATVNRCTWSAEDPNRHRGRPPRPRETPPA